MDTIVVELVSVGGRLVGRTASCRYNLAMLGLGEIIDDGRNGACLKRARRKLAKAYGTAFTLTKSRAKTLSLPTPAEISELGAALSIAA